MNIVTDNGCPQITNVSYFMWRRALRAYLGKQHRQTVLCNDNIELYIYYPKYHSINKIQSAYFFV